MSRTKELAKIIDDDVVTGQMVNNGAIVGSGSNDDGSYVRWENGEQVCFTEYSEDFFLTYKSSSELTGIWTFPAAFVGSQDDHTVTPTPLDADDSVGTFGLRRGSGDGDNDFALISASGSFGEDDTIRYKAVAWGFWK